MSKFFIIFLVISLVAKCSPVTKDHHGRVNSIDSGFEDGPFILPPVEYVKKTLEITKTHRSIIDSMNVYGLEYVIYEGLPIIRDVENDETYVVLDEFGSGNEGIVYFAISFKTGKRFAIKEGKKGYENLEQEASFVNYLGFGKGLLVVNNRQFIVMDELEGMSLDSYIRYHSTAPKKLTCEIFREITKKSSEALLELHSKAIVHADLHFKNIFVTIDSKFVAIDFGKAEYVGDYPWELLFQVLCQELSKFHANMDSYAKNYLDQEEYLKFGDHEIKRAYFYFYFSNEMLPDESSYYEYLNENEIEKKMKILSRRIERSQSELDRIMKYGSVSGIVADQFFNHHIKKLEELSMKKELNYGENEFIDIFAKSKDEKLFRPLFDRGLSSEAKEMLSKFEISFNHPARNNFLKN